MKLTSPKRVTFWISFILGVAGIAGKLTVIPFVSTYAFELLAIGFVLLVLGVLIKGL
jgi:hypothetical protein